MESLIPIIQQEFAKNINIKFNNINDGFNNFSNGILEPLDSTLPFNENQKNFFNFFQKVFNLNNHSTFIDFYLKNLSSEEVSNLKNSLNDKNKNILNNEITNLKSDIIYFKVCSNNLMDFITTLNTESLFFCTVFLKDFPLTIWGNYDLKFPVFFNDLAILSKYQSLAQECNLTINNIIAIQKKLNS